MIMNIYYAVRAKWGQQHNQACLGSSYVSLLLPSAFQPALILRGSPWLCALLCQGHHRQAMEVRPFLQAPVHSHLPFGFECWSQCSGTVNFLFENIMRNVEMCTCMISFLWYTLLLCFSFYGGCSPVFCEVNCVCGCFQFPSHLGVIFYLQGLTKCYGCQCLGFLTCTQMLMHVITPGSCTDTIRLRESTLKADSGRQNSFATLGSQTCVLSAQPTEPHPHPLMVPMV